MNKSIKITALIAICALASSCGKNTDLKLPLAVDSRYIILSTATGNTEVQIYSTDRWDVYFNESVDWASLNRLSGRGNDYVVLSYAANYDIARSVTLFISTPTLSDTVRFVQQGASVVMNLSGAATVEGTETKVELPLTSNLGNHLDEIAVNVEYQKYLFPIEDDDDVPEPETGWITATRVSGDKVELALTPNEGSRPRKAGITLNYTDVYGNQYKTVSTLTQNN